MRIFLPLALTAILAGAASDFAQSVPKPAAIVNGETISDADLARVADGRIRQLAEARELAQSDASFERDKLALRWEALNYLIERRLIRAEAARQMISEDALIEKEIDKRTELPSREVVAAFIEANRVRMPLIKGLSAAEVFSQVRGFIYLQANRIVHDAYLEKLSNQYGVKTYLEPLRKEIPVESHPSRGAATAPVTIVEFSSFDCATCSTLAQTLDALQKSNQDIVRLVYRQFPVAHLHPRAQKAAEAALCADKQQRFWEFHDSLFANQTNLNPDDLKKRAAVLGLDASDFGACLESGAQIAGVDKDIDEAGSAGVIDAPTIFINGRMISGNRSATEIQQIIDEEFRRVKQ